MPEQGLLAEKAVRLAIAAGAGHKPLEDAVGELAAGGNREGLERARAELVARIYRRSDDYDATAALSLVNRALAAIGWYDPYSWKHRRKP